jgi:hypothetical protein
MSSGSDSPDPSVESVRGSDASAHASGSDGDSEAATDLKFSTLHRALAKDDVGDITILGAFKQGRVEKKKVVITAISDTQIAFKPHHARNGTCGYERLIESTREGFCHPAVYAWAFADGRIGPDPEPADDEPAPPPRHTRAAAAAAIPRKKPQPRAQKGAEKKQKATREIVVRHRGVHPLVDRAPSTPVHPAEAVRKVKAGKKSKAHGVQRLAWLQGPLGMKRQINQLAESQQQMQQQMMEQQVTTQQQMATQQQMQQRMMEQQERLMQLMASLQPGAVPTMAPPPTATTAGLSPLPVPPQTPVTTADKPLAGRATALASAIAQHLGGFDDEFLELKQQEEASVTEVATGAKTGKGGLAVFPPPVVPAPRLAGWAASGELERHNKSVEAVTRNWRKPMTATTLLPTTVKDALAVLTTLAHSYDLTNDRYKSVQVFSAFDIAEYRFQPTAAATAADVPRHEVYAYKPEDGFDMATARDRARQIAALFEVSDDPKAKVLKNNLAAAFHARNELPTAELHYGKAYAFHKARMDAIKAIVGEVGLRGQERGGVHRRHRRACQPTGFPSAPARHDLEGGEAAPHADNRGRSAAARGRRRR